MTDTEQMRRLTSYRPWQDVLALAARLGIYTAESLWGRKAHATRMVVKYQIDTIDNAESDTPGMPEWERPGFASEQRRLARTRLRAGLPPVLGPDPRVLGKELTT